MADEVKAPDVAPVSQIETTPAQYGQGETPPVTEQDKADYFFEQQFDGDKEPTRFRSKDELAKYLREGTLRHRDYTKKTQSHAEERKAFEKQRTDFEQQMQAFMGTKTTYDQFDQFLRSRPDVKERIVREMKGTSPPSDTLKKQIMEEIQKDISQKYVPREDLERMERERMNEEYRNQVFESLGKRYQDFNKEDIMAAMEEVEGFQSLPPLQAMENFAELLYNARKGRQNPAKIEERIMNNLQKKAQTTTPMPGGLNGKGQKGGYTGSFDDIAAKLKAESR